MVLMWKLSLKLTCDTVAKYFRSFVLVILSGNSSPQACTVFLMQSLPRLKLLSPWKTSKHRKNELLLKLLFWWGYLNSGKDLLDLNYSTDWRVMKVMTDGQTVKKNYICSCWEHNNFLLISLLSHRNFFHLGLYNFTELIWLMWSTEILF